MAEIKTKLKLRHISLTIVKLYCNWTTESHRIQTCEVLTFHQTVLGPYSLR